MAIQGGSESVQAFLKRLFKKKRKVKKKVTPAKKRAKKKEVLLKPGQKYLGELTWKGKKVYVIEMQNGYYISTDPKSDELKDLLHVYFKRRKDIRYPPREHPKLWKKVQELIKKQNPANPNNPTGNPFKRCPVGTQIQTLIFSKQLFNRREAISWAKTHGFKASPKSRNIGKIEETTDSYRIRQKSVKDFDPEGFRTISLGASGVRAVIGCPNAH